MFGNLLTRKCDFDITCKDCTLPSFRLPGFGLPRLTSQEVFWEIALGGWI